MLTCLIHPFPPLPASFSPSSPDADAIEHTLTKLRADPDRDVRGHTDGYFNPEEDSVAAGAPETTANASTIDTASTSSTSSTSSLSPPPSTSSAAAAAAAAAASPSASSYLAATDPVTGQEEDYHEMLKDIEQRLKNLPDNWLSGDCHPIEYEF